MACDRYRGLSAGKKKLKRAKKIDTKMYLKKKKKK